MLELLFFSGKQCSVCQAIKPRLIEALNNLPDLNLEVRVIDIEEEIEKSAQHLVFTLPVLIIKKDEKEIKRFVRAFGIGEVIEYLERTQTKKAYNSCHTLHKYQDY